LNEDDTMQRLATLHAALFTAGLLALSAAHAQDAAQAEYKAAKDRISAEYKADKAKCDALKDNAKDICMADAKGKRDVAEAEAQFKRSGKPEDENKVAVTKAEAAYAVAKETCDDRSGNEKDVCIKDAKAVESRAKADAKASLQTAKARKP
jgi:hypothetical protein